MKASAPDVVSSSPHGFYSTAMFAHSLYYMPSTVTLTQTFKALREAGVKQLLLAEWALSTSRSTALPHLNAVLLQSVDPMPDGNVRTVLTPSEYIAVAKEAGWELVKSKTLTPRTDLADGIYEVRAARSIMSSRQRDGTAASGSPEATKLKNQEVYADAMESSLVASSEKTTTSMDVWTAVFKPSNPD